MREMKISEEGRIELDKIHSMCRMMEMELKLHGQEFDYNDLFDGFETPEWFIIRIYNTILPIGSINQLDIECVFFEPMFPGPLTKTSLDCLILMNFLYLVTNLINDEICL